MRRKERCQALYTALSLAYPDAACSLRFENAWQLLVAAILSAQCTDERVNRVTATLFQDYPELTSYVGMSLETLSEYIHSCGLYHSKAKHILATAERLVQEFDGQIPSEMEALLTLPGVGRKIANLLRGDYFHLGGVVVDTHCLRLAQRMGLSQGTRPDQVEKDLTPLLEVDKQSHWGHLMVEHGRACCTARKPNCPGCPVLPICKQGALWIRQMKKEGGWETHGEI